MNKSTKNWDEVHAALHAYFSTKPQRDVMLGNIETDDDFAEYTEADQKARLVAQKAFYRATSEINSMNKCLMVDAWEIARATGYDLTVHFPKAQKPQQTKGPQPFDHRRIEGWSK